MTRHRQYDGRIHPASTMSLQLVCLVVGLLGFFNPASAYFQEQLSIPPDYTSHASINVAYKVHTERKTWDEAKQTCLDENANLAVIDTMDKVRYVAGMKGPNVYVWVGIKRTSSSAPWVTAGSSTLMPDLPWAPGKPFGSHNCVAVRGCNRGLTNENCSSRKGFVCEMPLTENFKEIMLH